jgi:hypothetical protein
MDVNFNIFISHDNKDESVALGLKNFLENIFLNSSVYVSGRDLEGGQTWIENIKLSLKTAQVIISLITKESIKNNWIFFETGAGFVENKSIPLLADGLEFADLVPPLSLLQGRILSKAGIEFLISDISTKLNLRKPTLLTGINELLENSIAFFDVRASESLIEKKQSGEKKTVPNSIAPAVSYSLDNQDVMFNYNIVNERTIRLLKEKILSYKDKLDIPTQEELESATLSELSEVASAYNIPKPSNVIMNLLVLRLNIPGTDAKRWQKMNALKTIEDANVDLDKYEKSI